MLRQPWFAPLLAAGIILASCVSNAGDYYGQDQLFRRETGSLEDQDERRSEVRQDARR